MEKPLNEVRYAPLHPMHDRGVDDAERQRTGLTAGAAIDAALMAIGAHPESGWHNRPMALHGPPVEELFTALREQEPEIQIQRIRVKYPADDDNVWFIRLGSSVEVQIDTHPSGQAPFLIESDVEGQRLETSDPHQALAVILAWLSPP